MKDMYVVAKFTAKEMIKRKSFIVSSLILMALIIVGCNIPNILETINKTSKDEKTKVLLVDNDNIFEGNLSVLNGYFEGEYEFTVENKIIDEVKEQVNKGDYDYALEFKRVDENNLSVNYIVENFNESLDYYPEKVIGLANDLYRNMEIAKLGISEADLSRINAIFNVEVITTGENALGNIGTYFAISIILFYAVYFCAYQVSTAITVEKTSKIVETLATSTSTTNIIVGKTLGIGLVGLLQVIVLGTTAFFSAKYFLPGDILKELFVLENVTPILAIVTVLYFVIGYLFFSFMYALTGSTVAKPEDVQSANTPVTILTLIGFYLAYMTMIVPTGSLNDFASMFPLSSAFCMPCRMMMGLATNKDAFISLGILTLSTVLVASIAIKVYKSAILNTGTKMSIKEALQLSKNKKNK